MKLFVSINLRYETTKEVLRVTDVLKDMGTAGNYVPSENYHITLAYIGETDRLADAVYVLDRLNAYAFDIALDRIGHSGRTYWIEPKKNDYLISLMRLLCERLRYNGFEIEKRPPLPHITICRETHIPYRAVMPPVMPVSMTADCISLMKSERTDGHPVYTEMYAKNI